MTCNCRCHPAIARNCWCLDCMGLHIDFQKVVLDQMDSCEYCGDGIPKTQMEKHINWCKPMIEKNENSNDK